MTAIEWVDVSEHNNVPVDDTYPLKSSWFAYRICDGTYVDQLFHQNDNWNLKQKSLVGSTTYAVWPPSESHVSWQQTYNTIKSLLGNIHRPNNTIMLDVERWISEYNQDFSHDIEQLRIALVLWLYSLRPWWQRNPIFKPWYLMMDNRRVWGYGNIGDLRAMASHVNFRNVIVADYSKTLPSNYVPMIGTTKQAKLIAQQTTDKARVRPWPGNVDYNVSNMQPRQFALQAGIGSLLYVP